MIRIFCMFIILAISLYSKKACSEYEYSGIQGENIPQQDVNIQTPSDTYAYNTQLQILELEIRKLQLALKKCEINTYSNVDSNIIYPVGYVRYIDSVHDDEVFIIDNKEYEAKTYCFDMRRGDDVIFIESDPDYCTSAHIFNLRTHRVCDVWC